VLYIHGAVSLGVTFFGDVGSVAVAMSALALNLLLHRKLFPLHPVVKQQMRRSSDHLRPVAIAAGVVLKPGQRFGFHNLRHSLATFLINKEQDTKTVQGLLRHANVSTTLGLYAQSVNASMVEAQESMLKAILRNGSDAVNWFYR
jgi:integrase